MERGVKEGKLCATTSQSEQSRSVFAVARSGVIEKSGDRAEEIKKSMSKPNKRDDRFRGATKGRANIEIVINQHRDLLSFKSRNPVEFHEAT